MARLTTIIQGSKPKTISSNPLSYSGRQPKAGGTQSCKRRGAVLAAASRAPHDPPPPRHCPGLGDTETHRSLHRTSRLLSQQRSPFITPAFTHQHWGSEIPATWGWAAEFSISSLLDLERQPRPCPQPDQGTGPHALESHLGLWHLQTLI